MHARIALFALFALALGCSASTDDAPDCWGTCCQSKAPTMLRDYCTTNKDAVGNKPIAYSCSGTIQPGHEPGAAQSKGGCVGVVNTGGGTAAWMCCAAALTAPIE